MNNALEIANLSDEELAKLVVQGQHSAFCELVKRHSTKFYYLAFRILNSKEDAQDVVQDCFLKFWQDPTKWNEARKVKFTTWFYRVVLNRAFDLRKKVKELEIPQGFDIRDEAESAEVLHQKKLQNFLLDKAFNSLEKRQKAALALSFFEGKKNQESCKIMNLNLKAFQSLLIRSKKALKEKFEELGGNYE